MPPGAGRYARRRLVGADGTVISGANTDPRLVDGGIVEVVGKFSSPSWQHEVLCPSRFRFVEVEELDAALAEAGFAVVDRYGLWDRRPFTEQLPDHHHRQGSMTAHRAALSSGALYIWTRR